MISLSLSCLGLLWCTEAAESAGWLQAGCGSLLLLRLCSVVIPGQHLHCLWMCQSTSTSACATSSLAGMRDLPEAFAEVQDSVLVADQG